MGIVAARIDNRLLHGIVATRWTAEYRPQRLMVINDEYARDPSKKCAMRMAKPAGVALSIISRQTAYANFKDGRYDDQTVFVVVNDPTVIRELQTRGQSIPLLVIGGTASPTDDEDSVAVGRRARVLRSELETYRAIAGEGTSVVVQYAPTDPAAALSEFITD